MPGTRCRPLARVASASRPGSSPDWPATPPAPHPASGARAGAPPTPPGVRVALGRSTHSTLAARAERATAAHRHPHAAVGVLGQTAVVDLAVAVSWNYPLHKVA